MAKSLHLQADRKLIRAGSRSRRYLEVEVVAPRNPRRVPLNLSLVLDRSGSMDGDKLVLAREGAIRALRSLRDEDRLSVVIYNDRVVVLVPSRPADAEAKSHAEQVLRRIGADGNTDLCGGWLYGCEQVGLGLDGQRLGRCLLLTDGRANEGITDHPTIVRHAGELLRRGVTTSTLGVGRDFDESLLRKMAEAGGGNFYFAEAATQLSDFIAGETGEALRVVAREAQLVVDLPSGACVTSPNPFHARAENERTVFELGSLVADQVLRVMLCVELPRGVAGHSLLVQCRLRDKDGTLEGAAAQQLFTYASDDANDAQPREGGVRRNVAVAYAALARQRAAELGREGASNKGRAVLQDMADQVRQQAGNDPILLALVSELQAEARQLEQMDDLDYKRLQYSASLGLRSRGDDSMTLGTRSFTAGLMQQVRSSPASPKAAGTSLFVVAVTPDQELTRVVQAAGDALKAVDETAFGFAVVDSGTRMLDPGPGGALSRDDELGLAYAVAVASSSAKVAFVRGTLEGGVSSRWYAEEKVAIVSLGGGDEVAGPPPEALLAYEMVLQGSRHRRPTWDPLSASHSDVRGCWGDPGDTRVQVEAKLVAGDLCPDCRRAYEAAGVNGDQLLRLVATVRGLALRPAGVPS